MNANNTSLHNIAGANSLDELLSESGIKASDLIDQVSYNKNIKYHQFNDEAETSHVYGGDAKDEQKFFKSESNAYDLIDDMDWDEKDHFRAWAEGRFMSGQQYDGFSNMHSLEQERTRTYDKYLDQATLNEGITLSRRATAQLLGFDEYEIPTLRQLKKMKGKVVLCKGNLSTGAAKDGLTIGFDEDEKPVEYKIHIPGGTKGAGMWIGSDMINGWGGRQREFMTNRDSLFLIGDSKYETKTQHNLWSDHDTDIAVVHLYYIGRLKHDYS